MTLPLLPKQEQFLTKQEGKALIDESLRNFRVPAVMSGAYFQSQNFVSGSSGWRFLPDGTLEAVNATISGALSASTIDIGGSDVTSFHVDIDGNMWLGAATFASAPAKVSNAGAATFKSITLSDSVAISGIANNSSTDISLLEKTHNLVFSVTDANTIAWSSGTITLSNGRTFSISAGNTGNMAALTYIYLDTTVSSTVLQITTTYSTAMGANKILLGTAVNNTVSASFIPYGPGEPLIDGEQIGALSIVAANIAASTITAAKLSVSQLSAITADMGTITAGTVTGATIQTASSGTRFVMTSTAFQGINSASAVIFEIIISGSNAGDVIMGDDATGSYAFWDNSAGTFEVFADNVPTLSRGFFGGDGSDGTLSITSGTTTIDLLGAEVVVKNYTSISITGTGNLAFSNPHANGTVVILKSSGAVTLTSSSTSVIDVSNCGASGGASVSTSSAGSIDGNDGTDGTTNFTYWTTGKGLKGGNATGGGGGAALSGTLAYKSSAFSRFASRFPFIFIGAGGGSGSVTAFGATPGTATSGAGGRGGGGLIIESVGAFNFTTGTIKTGGATGSNGVTTHGGSDRVGAGGGGGGGGGYVLIAYNILTANTGTISVAGGAGGSGDYQSFTTDGGGSGGGGGGSQSGTGTAGTAGAPSSSGAGGAGANGVSLVIANDFLS